MPNCEVHPETRLVCPRCIRAKRKSYDPEQLAKAGKKGGSVRVSKGRNKKPSSPSE